MAFKEMLKELEQTLSNQYSAADTEKGSVYANELQGLLAIF